MPKSTTASRKEWAKMIANAWNNKAFKELLESDPKAAYKKMGLKGNKVLVIPEPPKGFSPSELEKLANLAIPDQCSWCTCC